MQLKTKEKVRDTCINATGSTDSIVLPYTELTIARCFKEQSLFFMNEPTIFFIVKMEKIFQTYYKHVCSKSINLKNFFINLYNTINFTIPNCHNLKQKIIKRFITFRLKKCL